jgi:hypothetical protein
MPDPDTFKVGGECSVEIVAGRRRLPGDKIGDVGKCADGTVDHGHRNLL